MRDQILEEYDFNLGKAKDYKHKGGHASYMLAFAAKAMVLAELLEDDVRCKEAGGLMDEAYKTLKWATAL